MFVVASPEQAEALLDAGKLRCLGCSGALRPYWYCRIRGVRCRGHTSVTVRPRRARCFTCAITHVLLPAGLVLRRADIARSRPGWTARSPRCAAGCAAGCAGHGARTPTGYANRACTTRTVPIRTS